MDTLVVKRLKAEALRDRRGQAHLVLRDSAHQRAAGLATLSPSITIIDEDKLQKLMEEMWKRTDIFDEKFMTEWTSRPIAQKMWAHATAYFGAKVRAIENFHDAGSQFNTYASANAATEIEDTVVAALDEFTTQNKENARAVNEVKEVREKIDTLQEAVALLAKTVAGREALTPRKRGRRSRRRQIVEESSDDEDLSSEEEDEEPTPPSKPKRKSKKK